MQPLNSNDFSDDDEIIDINHIDEVEKAFSVNSNSTSQESLHEDKRILPKKYRNMKYKYIVPFNYETNALRFKKTMKESFTFTSINQSDIEKKLGSKTNIVKRVSFFFVFDNDSVKTLFYDLAKTFFDAYYAVYKANYFFIGGDLKRKPIEFITEMFNFAILNDYNILSTVISLYNDYENLFLDERDLLGETGIENINGFYKNNGFDVSFLKELQRKVRKILRYRDSL